MFNMGLMNNLFNPESVKPDTAFRELTFSDTVGANNITSAFAEYGVQGNIIFIHSEIPIDIIINSEETNLNLTRQLISYPTKSLQIRKAASLTISDAGIGGSKCRIWGFTIPSVIDFQNTHIKPRTGLFTFSSPTGFPASTTTATITVDLRDRVLTFVELLYISVKRATSNLSRIRLRDSAFTSHYYGGQEFTPALLLTPSIFPYEIVMPNIFVIELEGVSNAAATQLDIELSYRAI